MSAAEDRKRIELAQQKIERLSSGGRDERRPDSSGSGKVRPSNKDVARIAPGVPNRPGDNEVGNRNGSYTPGQYREPLADGGTEYGGSKSARRRTSRVEQAVGEAHRKVTGPEIAVKTLEDRALGVVKKALAYAGFDVHSDARSLTEEEIERYRPDLVEFIINVGSALDWGLTHANRNHEESFIWHFEDDEATTLANIWLKRAKAIGWMAEVSRQVHHVRDVGDAKDIAAIVGKRIATSVVFVGNNGGVEFWLTEKK